MTDTEPVGFGAGSYREREPIDIEPLIRYLEVRGKGSWGDFDAAAKEVVTGLRHSYELGARLAAHCFLEFDWRDSSWRFGPTTLVEGRERNLANRSSHSAVTPSRWHLFGASGRMAAKLCELCCVTSAKTFVDLDLRRNRTMARFVRHALPIDYPADILERPWLPEIVVRKDLEAMFAALPSVKNSGEAFLNVSATEAAETLRAAAQTQKFDTATNGWVDKYFDDSIGFWRVDSIVKRYYIVSIVRDYAKQRFDPQAVGTRVHITRVSPELGRWICTPHPGTATVHASDHAMTFSLSRAVFDLPVLHERFLTLWGCERQSVGTNGSFSIRFNHIDATMARKFISLLSVRET